MTNLDRYKLINSCKTLQELSDAIIEINYFENSLLSTQTIASCCLHLSENDIDKLPTDYNIRQQGVYLLYKSESLSVERLKLEDVRLGDLIEYFKHMIL